MSVIIFSPAIGTVKINIFIDENHESNMIITEHPVESGANIQDHAIIKPKMLTVTFAAEKAAETYESLLILQATRQPFTIITGLREYQNMLIRSFKVMRDKRTALILKGTAILQEINMVSSSSVRLAKIPGAQELKNSANDRATDTAERGDVTEEEVSEEQRQDILGRLFGS